MQCYVDMNVECQNETECTMAGKCSDEEFFVNLDAFPPSKNISVLRSEMRTHG